MATLRIEHAIHDYNLWLKAFDSFEQVRAEAGVRSFAIRQPVNDPKYLLLDLEFDTQGQAESFAGFLHNRVSVIANVLPGAGWPSADQDSRPPAQGGMQLTLPGSLENVVMPRRLAGRRGGACWYPGLSRTLDPVPLAA